MEYYLLIEDYNGDIARLKCESLEELQIVLRSFTVYGKYKKISTEIINSNSGV